MQKSPLMTPSICPELPETPSGQGCKDSELLITSHGFFLWQSNIRGNWVEAPVEGESGALNESHMFPKMEAFQAAWALWAGGSAAPPALLAHTGLCTVHTVPFSSAFAVARPGLRLRRSVRAPVTRRKQQRLETDTQERNRELQLETKLTPAESGKVHIFPSHAQSQSTQKSDLSQYRHETV